MQPQVGAPHCWDHACASTLLCLVLSSIVELVLLLPVLRGAAVAASIRRADGGFLCTSLDGRLSRNLIFVVLFCQNCAVMRKMSAAAIR